MAVRTLIALAVVAAQAGVTPAGDNGTYLQTYTMIESRVDASASHIEIGGRRLALDTDFVLRSFSGRPLSGTWPVVYVGHGWVIPDKGGSRTVDEAGGEREASSPVGPAERTVDRPVLERRQSVHPTTDGRQETDGQHGRASEATPRQPRSCRLSGDLPTPGLPDVIGGVPQV